VELAYENLTLTRAFKCLLRYLFQAFDSVNKKDETCS
jgi:hypothetical protein